MNELFFFDTPLCFLHFPWDLEIWQETEAISEKKYNLGKISNSHLKYNPKITPYTSLYIIVSTNSV